MQYRITEVTQRSVRLICQLVDVWERSVRATHLFLSEKEIAEIRTFVPQALGDVPHLVVAWGEGGSPAAFMGVDGVKLEMLFLAPMVRGKGLGRQLIAYGIGHFGIREVTVNEQNPQALGFYEHMGFHVYRRSDRDEQGRPYPVLDMRL